MSDFERIKDNIRAMLNLAKNDAAADGEIRNALIFAKKLMDQHNLSEDDLAIADQKAIDIDRAEFGRVRADLDSKNMIYWESSLAMFVADFIGGVKCYCDHPTVARNSIGGVKLDNNGRPYEICGIMFYGIVEECNLAIELYQELRQTIAAMSRIRYGTVYRKDGREYCEGFVSGLFSKLPKQQLLPVVNTSTALVVKRNELVELKKEKADNWLEKNTKVRLRKRQVTKVKMYNPEARHQGRKDGESHHTSVSRSKKLGYQ